MTFFFFFWLRIVPSSVKLLEVIPICSEKPEIQSLELLRNNPPTPAKPGLPNELSFVFSFIKVSGGAFHLIILRILILKFFAPHSISLLNCTM